MARCNACDRDTGSDSRLCALCVAAVVNYEYDPDMRATLHDHPGVEYARREASRQGSGQGNGCALVLIALASVPVILAIAGAVALGVSA